MHYNASLSIITKKYSRGAFNYCDDFNVVVLDLLSHFVWVKPNFCSSSLTFTGDNPGKRNWAVV